MTGRLRGASRWQRRHGVFLAAVAACAAVWSANLVLGDPRPGSSWALGYGAAALLLLLCAAAYGVRRRAMKAASRRQLGTASAWLAAHVYGGVVFLLLVAMHSNFALPSGWVTWWLWGLSLWVVLGGACGLVLQRWIPRLLTSGLAVEAHYDRIPQLVESLRQRAEKLAAGSSPMVAELYERAVAPELGAPRRRPLYFLDVTGGIQTRLREFDYLARFLPGEERQSLRQLERVLRTKLELDAHYTLQQPLRWWLYLHLPPAVLLLLFVLLHLIAVFLY